MDVLAPDVVSVADGGGKCPRRGPVARSSAAAEHRVRYLMGGIARSSSVRFVMSPICG